MSINRQLVVSAIFLGLAVGQLFFGPLSDKTGRKPAIYAGLALYIAGSLISIFSINFPMMLVGRLLQGAGVSAPRAVGLALVRDRYEGRAMARVMSFVMTVFILVPMIAPMMGQTILLFSGWRTIFGSFVLLAVITSCLVCAAHAGDAGPRKSRPFFAARIIRTTVEIIKIRPALGYTIVAGLVSGAHLGYLSSAQQIFQEQYDLGELFPIYFATIALSIGLASFLNARLVMRFGMRSLVRWSLLIILGPCPRCYWDRLALCRPASLVVPDGLSHADILLRRHPLWQQQRSGHAALRVISPASAPRSLARSQPSSRFRWAQ